MKHILPQLFAVVLALNGPGLVADDSPINTIPKDELKHFPISKSKFADPTPSEAPAKPKTEKIRLGPRRQVEPELRDDDVHGSMTGVDRWGEIRAGVRFATLFGDITPTGGNRLNYRDDLQIKETSVGAMIDAEFQISPDTHVCLSFAQNSFNGQATLSGPIQYQGIFSKQATAVQLPAGSRINTRIDMNLFSGVLRYDLVKNDVITFSSLAGFKLMFIEEEALVSGTANPPSTDHANVFGGTPLVGFDMRVQLGHHVYTGLSAYGFGWDTYSYGGAQGYVGVDFSKRWGLRLGVDADYVDAGRTTAGQTYDTAAVVPSGFLQLVLGF